MGFLWPLALRTPSTSNLLRYTCSFSFQSRSCCFAVMRRTCEGRPAVPAAARVERCVGEAGRSYPQSNVCAQRVKCVQCGCKCVWSVPLWCYSSSSIWGACSPPSTNTHAYVSLKRICQGGGDASARSNILDLSQRNVPLGPSAVWPHVSPKTTATRPNPAHSCLCGAMAAKWDRKAVNKVRGRSLLPVGGLCETLQVFSFSLDFRAPCFVLFFCSSVLRLMGLSSGNSSSLQQSGHLFTLNHSWLSILVCLLKHASAFFSFSFPSGFNIFKQSPRWCAEEWKGGPVAVGFEAYIEYKAL